MGCVLFWVSLCLWDVDCVVGRGFDNLLLLFVVVVVFWVAFMRGVLRAAVVNVWCLFGIAVWALAVGYCGFGVWV